MSYLRSVIADVRARPARESFSGRSPQPATSSAAVGSAGKPAEKSWLAEANRLVERHEDSPVPAPVDVAQESLPATGLPAVGLSDQRSASPPGPAATTVPQDHGAALKDAVPGGVQSHPDPAGYGPDIAFSEAESVSRPDDLNALLPTVSVPGAAEERAPTPTAVTSDSARVAGPLAPENPSQSVPPGQAQAQERKDDVVKLKEPAHGPLEASSPPVSKTHSTSLDAEMPVAVPAAGSSRASSTSTVPGMAEQAPPSAVPLHSEIHKAQDTSGKVIPGKALSDTPVAATTGKQARTADTSVAPVTRSSAAVPAVKAAVPPGDDHESQRPASFAAPITHEAPLTSSPSGNRSPQVSAPRDQGVQIGQVDVFIEASSRPPARADKAPVAHDAASRHYLRRL